MQEPSDGKLRLTYGLLHLSACAAPAMTAARTASIKTREAAEMARLVAAQNPAAPANGFTPPGFTDPRLFIVLFTHASVPAWRAKPSPLRHHPAAFPATRDTLQN